jgi:predicted aspartyl protease
MFIMLGLLFGFGPGRAIPNCWAQESSTKSSGVNTTATQAPASATSMIPAKTGGVDPATGLDDSKASILPFEWEPPSRPMIVVQMQVNSGDILPFAIDTGASATLVVFRWAAEKTKLVPNGKTITSVPGNLLMQQTPPCAIRMIGTLDTKGLTYRFTEAYLMDTPEALAKYPGVRLAGIVGAPFFHVATALFDFDRKRLTFYPQTHAPFLSPTAPGAFTLPLEPLPPGAGPNFWLRVNFPPTDISGPMEIDTGNTATVLPGPVGKKIKPLDKSNGVLINIGGTQQGDQLLLADLSLGNTKLPLTEVVVNPQPTIALLGMNILSQYNFILDSRNGYVTFLPRKIPLNHFIDGIIKFDFTMDIFRWLVTKVPRDSDAERGGLKVGDSIETIDGIETSGMSMDTFISAVQGNAWEPATFVVERPVAGGDLQRLSLTIDRECVFPLLCHSSTGFTVLKQAHQPALVVNVDAGSAAAAAGLVIGDVIVAIEGVATSPLSPEKLGDVLASRKAGTVTLTLRRGSDEHFPLFVPVVAPHSAAPAPLSAARRIDTERDHAIRMACK